MEGKWEEMFALVDEMVETLGFCGTGEEVATTKDNLGPICSAAMWNEVEHPTLIILKMSM